MFKMPRASCFPLWEANRLGPFENFFETYASLSRYTFSLSLGTTPCFICRVQSRHTRLLDFMMFGLSLAKFVIVNDVGLDDVHHIRALASLAYAEHHKNLVY
jgi:hypothetical protein